MDYQVAEVVRFKLKTDVTPEMFLETNVSAESFIQTLPGSLYRSLCLDETSGQWTDILYWENMACAQNAGKAFKASPACQALMQQISPDSISMQHSQIRAALELYTETA